MSSAVRGTCYSWLPCNQTRRRPALFLQRFLLLCRWHCCCCDHCHQVVLLPLQLFLTIDMLRHRRNFHRVWRTLFSVCSQCMLADLSSHNNGIADVCVSNIICFLEFVWSACLAVVNRWWWWVIGCWDVHLKPINSWQSCCIFWYDRGIKKFTSGLLTIVSNC